MQQNSVICSFEPDSPWLILSSIEQNIKRKIEAAGKPLKEWGVSIYRGILTGCNEAFIINTDKRNEILSSCQDDTERKRTEELIRPYMRSCEDYMECPPYLNGEIFYSKTCLSELLQLGKCLYQHVAFCLLVHYEY